ncbi:MAG: V4R domain-containing protein [Candidatus Competibacterales bacterium]
MSQQPPAYTAIDPVAGSYTNYHNYFHPEEFFRHDPEKGAIILRDGQRAARVTEAFINGLHLGIEEEVGNASTLLMYRCGKAWAEQDMKRFNNRMRQEFGNGKLDIWQMNKRFVFESWWWPMTITGFGAWTLDLSFTDKDLTVVEIRNSAVAKSMKMLGKPVCHLYAGLFSGVFSVYDRKDRECIEIQCYSMGNDVCKFLIGDEKKVNAAEFWRREGAGASEILGQLDG